MAELDVLVECKMDITGGVTWCIMGNKNLSNLGAGHIGGGCVTIVREAVENDRVLRGVVSAELSVHAISVCVDRILPMMGSWANENGAWRTVDTVFELLAEGLFSTGIQCGCTVVNGMCDRCRESPWQCWRFQRRDTNGVTRCEQGISDFGIRQ
jgi:hypothetical protein